MKSVVRNLTGSTIVLPGSLNSFPLPAGQDKDFLYSGLSKTNVRTLADLALAGSISFPGSVGLGIPAGLQVTPSSTYAINGQEPQDPFDGDTVYSITDGVKRTFHDGVWQSDGFDAWIKAKEDNNPHSAGASISLKDGRLIGLAGSHSSGVPHHKCEIYDPSRNRWYDITDFPAAKLNPTFISAGVLQDGKVLVAGGRRTAGVPNGNCARSFLYDPATDVWTETGAVPVAGARCTAPNNALAIMTGGKALYCPGVTSPDFDAGGYLSTSLRSFLYDPALGTWAEMPARGAGRGHENIWPVALPDNKAFICGGRAKLQPGVQLKASNKVDIFDATAGTWAVGADLPIVAGEDDAVAAAVKGGRINPGVFAKDGKVIVAGGYVTLLEDAPATVTRVYRKSIAVYSVADDEWTVSSVQLPRGSSSPAIYDYGVNKVMIVGGFYGPFDTFKSFIYDYVADTLIPAADLPTRSTGHAIPHLIPWFSQESSHVACVDIGNGLKWGGAGTQSWRLQFSNYSGHNAVYLPAPRLSASMDHTVLTQDEEDSLTAETLDREVQYELLMLVDG